MRNLKAIFVFCRIAAAWFMLAPGMSSAQTGDLDAKLLLQLQETIRQQQELLQRQSAQIQAQSETLISVQRQLDTLKHETAGAQTQAVQALAVAQQAATSPPGNRLALVTTTQEHSRLAISGQVNRAINVVNDGKGTAAYFVDNDASNSRVRFVATRTVNDDTSLGARFEVAVAPDESSDISQTTQASGDFFNQRWAEVSLDHKQYGKLSLGKGDTASNNTAEADLSQTDIVQYSGIADIVGGMLFRESADGHALTDITVADAFYNQDGLSRQSRLRYDTPTFAGFSLAGSLVTNQRSDVAIFWNGKGDGFQATAAAAIANPQGDDSGLRHDGSFSLLHSNSGLNLTLSAGLLDRDDHKDQSNLYAKLGWITNFFDFGPTAFGVDFARSANLPADNDTGYSYSFAAVQSFDQYGAELYFQCRRLTLERSSGTNVSDLDIGSLGTRVKF